MLQQPQYVGFLNSAFNLVHMAWHLYMDFGGWYTLGMLYWDCNELPLVPCVYFFMYFTPAL